MNLDTCSGLARVWPSIWWSESALTWTAALKFRSMPYSRSNRTTFAFCQLHAPSFFDGDSHSCSNDTRVGSTSHPPISSSSPSRVSVLEWGESPISSPCCQLSKDYRLNSTMKIKKKDDVKTVLALGSKQPVSGLDATDCKSMAFGGVARQMADC